MGFPPINLCTLSRAHSSPFLNIIQPYQTTHILIQGYVTIPSITTVLHFLGCFKKKFLIPLFFSKISPQIFIYRADPQQCPLILLHVFPLIPGKHLRIPSERGIIVTRYFFHGYGIGIPALLEDILTAKLFQLCPQPVDDL